MGSPDLGVIVTNPTARKVIYSIYIVAGFILGGIQAWYGNAAPEWLGQYLQVYGYVGLGVSGLAIANMPAKTYTNPGPTPGPEDYVVDTSDVDETDTEAEPADATAAPEEPAAQ